MNKYQKAIDIVKDLKKENQEYQELKEVWEKEEWCKGIPLNASGLKSLFNYNEKLFEENLALDKKKLELEYENRELEVFVAAYAHARDELLIKNEQLEKENLKLRILLEPDKQDMHYLSQENKELKDNIDSEVDFTTKELFKWRVRIGEYGEGIADGWVYADSITEAEKKVKKHYTNCYHNVEIDEDYDSSNDKDVLCGLEDYKKYGNDVFVRWED